MVVVVADDPGPQESPFCNKRGCLIVHVCGTWPKVITSSMRIDGTGHNLGIGIEWQRETRNWPRSSTMDYQSKV